MKKVLFSIMIFAAGALAAQDQFQKEAVRNLEFTKGRIAQLADAMPDDKFAWSPAR